MKSDAIHIKGARLHNLKNIDVRIPRNQLTVITGLSGSGKSSLAFDTLYAEGQRRYVESLSSYARQFLGKLDKPNVDSIQGISPAIAIEQKVNSTNPRSTVGSSTELYDYLRLLFARIGTTYSPVSNEAVQRDTVSDVVDFILGQKNNTKLLLLSPIALRAQQDPYTKAMLLGSAGFARIFCNNEVLRIDQLTPDFNAPFSLVVDRVVINQPDEDFINRLSSAVDNAFYEGRGQCEVLNLDNNELKAFNDRFEKDGILFDEPSIHLFNSNNPFGACKRCEGYGDVLGIDPELVIPDTRKSIYEGAIAPWNGERFSKYKEQLMAVATKQGISVHKPWHQLSEQEQEKVWNGGPGYKGIYDFFDKIEEKTYKIQNRVLLSRYRGKSKCPSCKGSRLRKEASYVKIDGYAITDLMNKSIIELKVVFDNLSLNAYQESVAKRILIEIRTRLDYLDRVGLAYLTLSRKSNTLSGGESQRINLATSVGSSLVGSMYILDEPSIGLHSKDTENLISVLKALRDLGNTVIVVEHDEDIMKQADHIIDIGPMAGALGGHVVAQGTYAEFATKESLTAQYLSNRLRIEIPAKRKRSTHAITFTGARLNNLKNISVTIPLNAITAVTGVSGSGKSTLVRDIVFQGLAHYLGGYQGPFKHLDSLEGDLRKIKAVEFVDQNPIGRSSRSNPVTYIKAYDDIRSLYASQKQSKLFSLQPKHFSFNVEAGRCETCKGEGTVTVEMQFMADVVLTCEDCKGKRFKEEILEVRFHEKSIYDLLQLTIDQAIEFFELHGQSKLAHKLQPLKDVGLGYVTLGQSSSTLSGGEAQRIKLASFLSKGSQSPPTLFIFDEPTTGLHFEDVKTLKKAFDALITNGHSILLIEHHLDLIKCADYVIELGPVGGTSGGYLISKGTPEEIATDPQSITAPYLAEKLAVS
ncbi:MAG: excinuclease ABC subunit UvrA [Flavobacteriaceae bacterium]